MKKQSDMMLKADDLHAFLRFEIKYSSLSYDEGCQKTIHAISITYEDILAALHTMEKEQTGILTINEEWLEPLLKMGDEIGLPALLGVKTIKEADLDHAYLTAPMTRSTALKYVFMGLRIQENSISDGMDEPRSIHGWTSMLENVLYNEKHPMNMWHLTDIQKLSYVENVFNNDEVDKLNDEEKELFKRCLEAECNAGSNDAWRIKAYCLFEGNAVYSTDYEQSAEILSSLYEEDNSPEDANTLGVIFYTSDEPDYEQAYQYFTVGAFNDIDESLCYCADMLVRGQGVQPNMSTAWLLSQKAYAHSKAEFTDGVVSCTFAEAAMRMGECERYGIGTESDGMLACSYYLETMNALSIRMRTMQRHDDVELYAKAENALKDCEETFGSSIHNRVYQSKEPYVIDRLLSSGHPLAMKIEEKDGRTLLVFTRLPAESEGFLLLTCEEMAYSKLARQFIIEIDDFHSGNLNPESTIVFDQVGYDDESGETFFLNNGKTVGSLICQSFSFADDRNENWWKEPLISFAAVSFPGERKEYVFICTLDGLKRGDHVLVETKYGIEEAVFLRQYYARMSDMPRMKYRHILQKADFHFYA